MKITECRVCHLENPLGYRIGKPVFSWLVEGAKGSRQASARVRVSESPRFSSFLLDTGFSNKIDPLAFEADLPLKPRTRYYWDASVRTDLGEEASSDTNWFETGKRNEPWAAQWITCDSETTRHPIFYKDIRPKKPVKEARLYLCGLGLYEAYLNGEKISDERLTPYSTDYHRWVQSQTYDVTGQLSKGGRLEVLLGNGWYKGRFGFAKPKNGKEGYYGSSWALIAELRLKYQDGTEDVIGTDRSWMVRRSRIFFSGLYDGEKLDATLPETRPVPADLCRETPPMPEDRLSTPVRARETLKPEKLIRTPAGETVLDLGQNMAGVFRLSVQVPKGQKVHLQFGEILQGGNFYRENLRSAKAEYVFLSDGKRHILEPHFTYYGYRYCKVEGIPDLKKEDFTGIALYSEIPETGRLRTGNSLVNRLIRNTEWGQKSNFIDVPTDCPQRDERMGWTGDAQVFSPTACFLRDCYAFYRKYLHDMGEEQKENGGMVPNTVPAAGNEGCSAVWGDAACIIPWNVYRFYGDRQILEESYAGMKAWVDYITRVDGGSHRWRTVFHFGDWLALDNPDPNEKTLGGTDNGLIADTYYRYSAMLTARAARVLGKTEDEKRYDALSDRILSGLRDEYFSKTGRCCVQTQTALVLALRYGLTPDRARTRADLQKLFRSTKNKLRTGFVGTPLLCNVLSAEGMDTIAYHLLLNEEYPGWLYEVNLGATTIWERWNSLLPDGRISSTGMNSLNHYAYGSIVEWIWRRCAGLEPLESAPGFRCVRLRPMPEWHLRHLEAEYHSASGVWRSSWNMPDESHVELRFSVPFGCRAEAELPCAPESLFRSAGNPLFADVEKGVCRLGPGDYAVSYRTASPLPGTREAEKAE